jgi:hypothetical protein
MRHYLASVLGGYRLVVEVEDRAGVSAQAHRPSAGSGTVDARTEPRVQDVPQWSDNETILPRPMWHTRSQPC